MMTTAKVSQRAIPQNRMLQLAMHPVLEQLFLSRGATTPDDYLLELGCLLSPQSMLNIEQALELLVQALKQQEKILVIGDFDADGATSTALLLLALREFGYTELDYLVPNRFEFGYGLTPEIVEVAKQRHPALIITVDNGIASFEGVEKARALGIKVLITDHHLPADSLPQADAILNPNQAGCPFPSKALAGVGVAYYLLLALRSRLRELHWFAESGREEPNMLQFLDLVALGTVADVVPLDRNNRCLVKHGLELIRSGRGRPGIRTLITIAGRDYRRLQAGDLGFVLGPRLNAAGRLDDMSVGIECLLAESEQAAMVLARLLNDLNQDRKSIEQNMQEQALSVLKTLQFDADSQAGICLFDPDWHAGVVGILASRMKDRFHRPAIIFARSPENPYEIKGSARSISGLHIRDLLDRIATRHPGLLSRFGGHAMAAGLSLALERFEDFRRAFETELNSSVDAAMLQQKIVTDGELAEDCLTLEFAELLEQAGPWGQQFPEPLFTGSFSVVQSRVLADRHLKLVLSPANSQQVLDAIAFNVSADLLAADLKQLQIAYRLQINEYRGQRSVQLLIEHFLS